MSDVSREIDLSQLSRKNRIATQAEKPAEEGRTLSLAPKPKRPPEIIQERGEEESSIGERTRGEGESVDGYHSEVGAPRVEIDRDRDYRAVTGSGPSQGLSAQTEDPDSKTISMTSRVTEGSRKRARQAYRLTSGVHGDASFGAFVEEAIEREVKRRQDLYNNGKPFPENNSRLPTGPRPGRD